MKILFHRSSTIEVKVQKPDTTRAFVFDVQVGFSKDEPQVDPLSGMLINLVKVDQMLRDLAKLWSQRKWSSCKELLEKSKEFFEACAKIEGVFLEELCLMEKRGFWLKWHSDRLLMGQEVLREINETVYRLHFESAFKDSTLEQQSLQFENAEELLSQRIFYKNQELESLEVENLVSREKWILHKV